VHERLVDAHDRRHRGRREPPGEIGDGFQIEGANPDDSMIQGTPRVANSFNPVPSAARPSRTALRMLFSFTCVLRLVAIQPVHGASASVLPGAIQKDVVTI
jgi:hypothetical protein